MDVGVVLQTNPPAARVVELARQAELHGFSHVWTFDSHLLWQEPYVIHSQILAATRTVVVGPMVTNPATRDWTVTASTFATLNGMFGNRTVCGIGRGDSAVRVTNGKPTTLATLRECVHVVRELANGRAVEYNGSQLRLPWAGKSRLEVWIAAYGPKALTDYIAGRSGYDYNEHGRAGNPHTSFVPDEIVDRFCVLGPVQEHVSRLSELAALGVDQFAVYLQHDGKEQTLAAYGEQVIPAVTDHLPARS